MPVLLRPCGHVTHLVLTILQRDVDMNEVFATPVAEAFPEIADAYVETIEEPMDFRTIAEERLPAYESIQELQEDLLLTFRNCMMFNDNGSEFWLLSK